MTCVLEYHPMTTVTLPVQLTKILGIDRKLRYQIGTGSTWEVFSALRNTIPGFSEAIRCLERKGMVFAIFRNGKNVGEDGFDMGGTRAIRIIPILRGSKRGGVLQTILGVVLIVAGYFVTTLSWGLASPVGGGMISAGVGMVAGGVIQMLSPQAGGLRQSAAPENLPSYAFGSAKNTTAAGNPVPICYGKRRWGGVIISASIYAEDKV